MCLRKIYIYDLQPSDLPRRRSLDYFEEAEEREINRDGLPQVWDTPKGVIISDGNNRVYWKSLQGKSYVLVDFQRLDPRMSFILEDVLEGAEVMRQRGIHSVADICEDDVVITL